mmetsp:Transcript_20787/g.42023  ORF Transcript_20787/g.42023 Transcript_20787/m.42023 type:complete len:335 (-) Transcript_20787:127-1131(-)
MLLHGKHGQRVLASVQGFGIGFHIRCVSILKTRVVTDGQRSGGSERSLDRVNDEERVVLLGEFSCLVVEIPVHDLTRLAFAHHRLDVQGFDMDIVLFGVFEGLFQTGNVVWLYNNGHVALWVLETGQMFLVDVPAGFGEAGRPVCASVESSLHAHHHAFSPCMGRSWSRLELGMNVGDPCGELNRFRATVHAHKACVWAFSILSRPSNLRLNRFREVCLTERRCHDVCHAVFPTDSIHQEGRVVTKPKHSVSTRVVHYRTVQRHNPRPLCSKRHERHDRIRVVKVDVSRLEILEHVRLVFEDRISMGVEFLGQNPFGVGECLLQVLVLSKSFDY